MQDVRGKLGSARSSARRPRGPLRSPVGRPQGLHRLASTVASFAWKGMTDGSSPHGAAPPESAATVPQPDIGTWIGHIVCYLHHPPPRRLDLPAAHPDYAPTTGIADGRTLQLNGGKTMTNFVANAFEKLFALLCILSLIVLVVASASLTLSPEPVSALLFSLIGFIVFLLLFGVMAVFLDCRKCLRKLVDFETQQRDIKG